MIDSDFQLFDDLVGIPYKIGGDNIHGFDCGGLVRYIYRERLSLELPSFLFDVKQPHNPRNVLKAFEKSLSYWEKIDDKEEFCLVAMSRRGKAVSHCGVYTGENRIIHAVDGLGVRWESFREIIIQHKFQFSFYRWNHE